MLHSLILSIYNPHSSNLPIRPCFFFNDTATTEISPLSLHDALPITRLLRQWLQRCPNQPGHSFDRRCSRPSRPPIQDRKSTRLNSSHSQISYAVFCLKKKSDFAPRVVLDPALSSDSLRVECHSLWPV